MNTFKTKNIKREGLGIKLIQARQKKNIEIKQASLMCKIPEKYLESLEQENWKALPGEVYVKNFLKKYCRFLGIHFGICFKQYKEQSHKSSLYKINQNNNRIIDKISEKITPHKVRLFLSIFVLLSVIGYITYAVSIYTRPPKLEILSPEKNYSTLENVINIKGITEPESVLFVNGESFPIESNGNFNIEAKLKYGLNMFEIISQRKHGRQHKENVVVFKKKD